jgi:hypothetical protein
MKQWALVGILVGAMAAGAASAQQRGDGPGTRTPTAGQPNVAPSPPVPSGDLALGTVRIPRRVMANGQPLAAGSYQVRLTAQEAGPPAVGITPSYERWVEFVQGGQVRGREVVSIVPAEEIKTVAEDAPPSANTGKAELLRGNDYVRVWINRGGNHYLLHLPVAS